MSHDSCLIGSFFFNLRENVTVFEISKWGSGTSKFFCLTTGMILSWAQKKHIFWKLVHTCLWKEPGQVFDRVVLVELEWKYHCFWNVKTREWDLNIFLFNHWNDLVLGSVETYFLKVGAYVSLKPATTGVW